MKYVKYQFAEKACMNTFIHDGELSTLNDKDIMDLFKRYLNSIKNNPESESFFSVKFKPVKMNKYAREEIHTGDYIQLNLCDGWFKVTNIEGDYLELVDQYNSPTDCQYNEVIDLRLPSEMEYAF